MNPKILMALKIVAAVLIIMLVVILLSANKITSSIALTIMAIVILLPFNNKRLKLGRIIFVAVVSALVIWNISTTDLPRNHYETGFRFFDQVIHIFQKFMETVFGRRLDLL
jgi:chromate transport protein ChrA